MTLDEYEAEAIQKLRDREIEMDNFRRRYSPMRIVLAGMVIGTALPMSIYTYMVILQRACH